MRILIVTPWFPTSDLPESGIFVAREAEALAAEHDVTVVHFDAIGIPGESVIPPGVGVSREFVRLYSPASLRRARKLVNQAARDADVVHTHALPGLLPWIVGRPSKRPWVHTEHWSGLTSPETLPLAQRAVRQALLPILRRPDVVITECQRLADAVRRHRKGRVELVPCIVDSITPPDRPAADEVLRIVSVGGLIPRKGPGLALDAVKVLRDRGTDARLTWVGDGPQRQDLECQVAAEGLESSVTFTGSLPSTGVSDELAKATLFLLPTQGDNFCVVTAEALVHGRPVVSGANTGAVDYCAPSVSVFVEEQTGIAYADAVAALHAKTAELASEDVAATVRGLFSAERVRSLLGSIYSTVD
ncbi:glycosyltransferase [Microbacterium esteraromaticum]|uniref:D-inositol 3-phosphate glycosyltransferase n=1 Tax=Microbacterium esteraromaticum TaxID=57043 RepID=A0A939IRF6_9MICO|nr:glycosyltransferase [Microbacterium esteraromaticum]MBN8415854.1 glycosyltransferase [Microbacterium esteraromaticum]